MEFEYLFKDYVLDRGYTYSQNGSVSNLNISKKRISASVMDNDIEIILRDADIYNMSCTCDFYFSGNNCKHIAAVLYEATNPKLVEKEDIVTKILEDLDEKSTKEFLKDILLVDNELRERFIERYKYEEINDETIINNVKDIFKEYKSNEFTHKLEVLKTEIIAYIFDKSYLLAFLMIQVTIEELILRDIKNEKLVKKLVSNLQDILDSNEDIEDQIYEWIIYLLEGESISYITPFIEQIYADNFYQEIHLQKKICFIDDMITKFKDKEDSFELKKWLVYKSETMKELNYSEKEISDLFKSFSINLD